MAPPNTRPLPDLTETRAFTPRVMRWGFGAVMAVIVCITALSFWRTEADRRAMNEIVHHRQAAAEIIFRMQLAARDRVLILFGAVHTEDPFVRDSEIQHFYALGNDFVAARMQLLELDLSEAEHALLARQGERIAQIGALLDRVIELLDAERHAEAERLMIDHVVPAQNQMIEALTALMEHEIRVTRERAAAARKNQNRTGLLFLLGGLIGVLLTWGILRMVSRKMSGLIAHLSDTGERLRESNLDLQFQKHALDEHNIVSMTDVHGTITAVNGRFCEVSQYSREELLGRNHRLLKSGRHPDTFYEDMWATISTGRVWHGEVCNRRKDGTFYWVASTILPFVGEDGLPSRYVSVRTDITAIKEAQLVLERSRDELEQLVQVRTGELAEREEMLRSILRAAQDALIMVDPAGRVTYWNPAAEHLFGFAESEIVGKDLHDMIVPERDLERAHTGFSHFALTGDGTLIDRTTTLQAKHKNGKAFPVDISLSSFKFHGKWSAVGIVRDATERMKAEERLPYLATTDTLTGLCNRRCLNDALVREINRAARYASPLSLILFDIDHFKRINDTFGHQAGDQVLKRLTVVVGGAIRTTDLFARWGGEEFVVLLPGSGLDAARLLAEKLRVLLEKHPFPKIGQVTCSFGVTGYAPGDGLDGLMEKADFCLYRAKTSGRNRVEIGGTIPAPDAG